MGGTEHEFRKRLQTIFAKVKTEKPDASRKQSTEGFFVALGYKPLQQKVVTDSSTKEDISTINNAANEKVKEDVIKIDAENGV